MYLINVLISLNFYLIFPSSQLYLIFTQETIVKY